MGGFSWNLIVISFKNELFFNFKIIFHLYLEFEFLDELLYLGIVWIDGTDFLQALQGEVPFLEIYVVYSHEIEDIGIVRIFLEEEIGIVVRFFVEAELMPEIREHIEGFCAILIERKESLIYLIGYLVLSLNRECEAELEIELGIRIVHEDEVFIYEFCFFVVSLFFIERGEETIEVLVELLDGETFYDTSASFTEFTSGYTGFDRFYELNKVLFLVS